MSVRNSFINKYLAALAVAATGSTVAGAARAHVFDQATSAADSESRGNDNYASLYNWRGSTRNYELVSAGVPTRHSYALQIFDMSTKLFGDQRQLIRVSSSADAWYKKNGANAAVLSRMQSASVIINDVELLRCTASDGCSDLRDVPRQVFYIKSKEISFGALGSETLESRITGDISLDVSSTSTSSRYLGIATGFLSNSIVNLKVGVHVFSRQLMDGTDRNYRLLNVDIDAREQARQATTGTVDQTGGRLTWSNREFVDMAHMNGRISFTKTPAIGPSVTRELVNVPEALYTGQYIDDVGSTTEF